MDSGGLSLGLQKHGQQFRSSDKHKSLKTTSAVQEERALPVTVAIRGEGGEGSALSRAEL